MADSALDKTTLSTAVALGQRIGQPITSEAIHYAIVPEGSKVESLIHLQYPNGLAPDRIKANLKIQDATSFCKYIALYQDDRTRILADARTATFLAVLDYHGTGERKPEFLDHRATLQLTVSEQWKIWSGKDQQAFSQNDFAEFLEDNYRDIAEPAHTIMLEVARDLHAKTEVNFDSKVTPKNGQVQLRFQEDIKAGVGTGSMEVPEQFTISIPVFYGEDPVRITARLRFRISQGKLTFFYKLYRPAEVLHEAFQRSVASVAQSTGIDVILGTL